MVRRVTNAQPRLDDLLLLIQRASSIVEQANLQSLLDTTIDTAIELTDARYGALPILHSRTTRRSVRS